MKAVFPNTFLVGIQKAGTTTLDAWLSQHPEIYCYDSLKDVHLFGRFKSMDEIMDRMAKETPAYKGQPIVLQSAVNYIFYPFFMEAIAKHAPGARLIVILRNPVDRAISSYYYFKKMLREKRGIEQALLYEPQSGFGFSPDNSDFTYIEHGFYHKQITDALKYFSREQLLVVDYSDLATKPAELVQQIFSFLGIDDSFVPDFEAKNVTGNVKSEFLQSKMLKHNRYRKWMVDNLVDSWFPVNKRKMLKKRIFEMNTSKSKKTTPVIKTDDENYDKAKLKEKLKGYFIDDVRKLDTLLNSNFYEKWFGN